MASFAARSFLRSAATSSRRSAARIAVGVKPRVSPSSFGVNPVSSPIFRSVRCVSAVSMLPYHTATASALLTSMLSVVPRSRAHWTLEDN